jgi:hypothetical protein
VLSLVYVWENNSSDGIGMKRKMAVKEKRKEMKENKKKEKLNNSKDKER